MSDVSRETSQAIDHYSRIDGLAAYADILASDGVERGLIGPREVPRIWTRHIANCAVVAECELVPEQALVIDVGSGAGLPGLVWALVRPDVRVVLVEPLLRRSTFLEEVVGRLGLGARVAVQRCRAEEYRGPLADVVTARAVAPLSTLAGWTLRLTRIGGTVIALKGSTVTTELQAAEAVIRRSGGDHPRVESISGPGVTVPTTVVVIPKVAVGTSSRPRPPARNRHK